MNLREGCGADLSLSSLSFVFRQEAEVMERKIKNKDKENEVFAD